MTNMRRAVIGIIVVVVLYVGVFVVLAPFVGPSGTPGEHFTGPIPTEAIGPLSELEFVDGEGSDSAAPITP